LIPRKSQEFSKRRLYLLANHSLSFSVHLQSPV
jgi:hypothetical protein